MQPEESTARLAPYNAVIDAVGFAGYLISLVATAFSVQIKRPAEKAQDFSLRVQCMTAAHLGLSVIKMNWKQKDRLAQALGFMPYNEHEWSRRESLDVFREALFKRQVVIRDGKAVHKKDLEGGTVTMTEENGVFLAKEYANRMARGGVSEGEEDEEATSEPVVQEGSSLPGEPVPTAK